MKHQELKTAQEILNFVAKNQHLSNTNYEALLSRLSAEQKQSMNAILDKSICLAVQNKQKPMTSV